MTKKNKKMILGSHNSMTYLKPRKWWMRIGLFMAKCQNLKLEEQYQSGVRWFDIRISFPKDRNGNRIDPVFSHGIMDFKGLSVSCVLEFLNSKPDAYCRLVLEKGGNSERELFKFFVLHWLKVYPNLKVTQIARKGEWVNLLEPNASAPYGIKDAYASANGFYPRYSSWPGILKKKVISGCLLDDLCPWIYAKLHNKKNLTANRNSKIILLIDFVGTE